MRRLQLDFVAREPVPAGAWVALVLATACAAATVFAAVRLTDRVERTEAQNARLRAKLERPAVATPARDAHALEEEIRRARLITQQLAFPWGNLLDAIEAAATKQTALLALQPDVPQGLIRITAEAKELSDAIEYVRQLSASPALRNVHLSGHQIQAQDPQRPVKFVVTAQLPAAGPAR
jgi:hypothetical protein